jgi:hypothetical protein
LRAATAVTAEEEEREISDVCREASLERVSRLVRHKTSEKESPPPVPFKTGKSLLEFIGFTADDNRFGIGKETGFLTEFYEDIHGET